MRAVVCTKLGLPEDLEVREVSPPRAAAGEVLVRVHAASVNFPDGLMIAGRYQNAYQVPFTPGQEVSGVVQALGDGVSDISVGDRVVAFTGCGGFAEYVAVPAASVVRLADTIDLDEAAAFTSVYGTTHHAYRQRAELKAGETVLVLGAGGGVGLAAVDLGKLLGARVIAAASTDIKLDLARAHGADHLINYRTGDLRKQLKAITERGPDVVYDPIGGELTEQAFRSIAWNGRYLVIGFASGTIPSLPLNLALLKGASATGVFFGAFMEKEPQRHRENLRELFGWFAEGKLKPHIGQRFSLAEAPRAIRLMQEGGALGKLIISMN
jgi:NADPH:quinone reductase